VSKVILIGASPLELLTYENVFEAAIRFHPNNMILRFRFEKI
jgi:hypothetical protein